MLQLCIVLLYFLFTMLRSFEGRVQFDVAAEARLDSNMNIRIPTLRSAMYIKGDSLVLMAGMSGSGSWGWMVS